MNCKLLITKAMKLNIKNWQIAVLLLITSICFGNCANDDYLVDGGKSNPYYDGTILEFLHSRSNVSDPKNNYFSDLVKIIEQAGMEKVLEQENITFFAPTNWAISRSMNALNRVWYASGNDSVKDLRQISPEVWKEFLSMYILKEKLLLKDIPQIDTTAIAAYPGQVYISYGGTPMNAGVVYGDVNGVKYAGPRQILFSYIYDITVNDMENAYIATSDIQPRNGALHVIRLTDHDFGFSKYNFVTKAIEGGIRKLSEVTNKTN